MGPAVFAVLMDVLVRSAECRVRFLRLKTEQVMLGLLGRKGRHIVVLSGVACVPRVLPSSDCDICHSGPPVNS